MTTQIDLDNFSYEKNYLEQFDFIMENSLYLPLEFVKKSESLIDRKNTIINIDKINEDDIITGPKNVPTIWYNDLEGNKHRHFVDIFIPSQNRCIEVKSSWTVKKDNVFFKQNAAKELGYLYEIWVYNEKGTIINKFI